MEHFSRKYFQAHKPAAKQDSAEGHAVRLVYLCTAMADVAASTQDQSMLDACRDLSYSYDCGMCAEIVSLRPLARAE